MKQSKVLLTSTLLAGSLMFSSCIGSFSLTQQVYSWNQSLGSKWVNQLVFWAFNIVPVYPVAVSIDTVILNLIEFWSGSNPLASTETKEVVGEDGNTYLVQCDPAGYTITRGDNKEEVRFNFDQESNTWSLATAEGDINILTYMSDNQVKMYDAEGGYQLVDLSQEGVMAYKNSTMGNAFFANK